jgi:hypothetical protein
MYNNALKNCKNMRIYLTILLFGLSTLLSGQTQPIDTINFKHALDKYFPNSGRKYFIEDLVDACNKTILT